MTNAVEVFDAEAAGYERQRRRLVPPYDAFYGTAVGALELAGRPLGRVLDLGAATGLLSRQVAAAHPQARLTLLDGSPAMLEQARAALGEGPELLVGDLADPLPAGPWDGVVSALAIHHLDDAAKRSLFARVHAVLAPGGVFVNAEQVLGPTPALDAAHLEWHRRASQALGATDEEWAGAMSRMEADDCATASDQLRWLAETGFEDVDCLFRQRRFAVLVGRRPA